MATKKKDSDESEKQIDVTTATPVFVPEPVKKVPRPRPTPKVKRISFHQYAVLKDIPERHRPGLTAFVKFPQKKRSIEEWDTCLKDY